MELHIKTESKGSTLSPLLQTLEQTPKYFGDCTIALRSNLLRELEGETSILATLRLQDIGFPDRTKLDSQVDTGFNSLARLESDNTPDSNHSLQPLSIMLYHIQFRRILEEYHAVDTDSARQEKVLMKLIIPLTQYSKACSSCTLLSSKATNSIDDRQRNHSLRATAKSQVRPHQTHTAASM